LTSYPRNLEVWDVKEGMIDLLSGPGLGIEIDEEVVREASKGAKALEKSRFYRTWWRNLRVVE
jgi:galactonate dehydratase